LESRTFLSASPTAVFNRTVLADRLVVNADLLKFRADALLGTAKLLIDNRTDHEEPRFAPETDADWSPTIENTTWGDARRVLPPVEINSVAMRWDHPAGTLGSAAPRWA